MVIDVFYTVLAPNSSIKGAGGWLKEREKVGGEEDSPPYENI